MLYSEENLVAVAKRENNTKRNYLVVNRLQGKHIPVSPQKAFEMFDSLAEIVKEKKKEKKILIVGFAETATAIGSEVAIQTESFFIQTTREQIEDVEYFYFSEAHSHATEQKLVKTDIDKIINKIDRIIFVEDEVTTGNTILNIVKEIKKAYPNKKISFGVVSILNGMKREAIENFEKQNVDYDYLVKTNHEYYEKRAEQFINRGESYCFLGEKEEIEPIELISFIAECNPRRLTDSKLLLQDCERAVNKLFPLIKEKQKILVLGTEEFMFPGLWIGRGLEKIGNEVSFHATTRSPIMPSREEDYPFHKRYQFRSLYEEERISFLYDIKKYDRVILVTDANCENNIALRDILKTLKECENQSIFIMEWRTKKNEKQL